MDLKNWRASRPHPTNEKGILMLISPEAESLLLDAIAHNSDIERHAFIGGIEISVNGEASRNKVGDRKSSALWDAGLNDLIFVGLIEAVSPLGSYYSVTREGYLFAENLDPAEKDVRSEKWGGKIRWTVERRLELLSEEATALLSAAVEHDEDILCIRVLAGTQIFVQSDGLQYKLGDRRSQANWEAGLKDLESAGFAHPLGIQQQVFFVSREGYVAAELLKQST